jgi:hypothetical protein
MVSVILDNLAEGETYESIIDGYCITREDIQGAIAFAANLAADRQIPLDLEPGLDTELEQKLTKVAKGER